MADCHLDLISKMASGLSELLDKAKQRPGLFYILIAKDVGAPKVITCETLDQCVEQLKELKSEQTETLYTYIFEGCRWILTKYPTKGIKCGERFVPLSLETDSNSENGEIVNLSEL